MKQVAKYRFGFDVRALILFIVMMLPNIIWFVSPNQDNLTSEGSLVDGLEIIVSIAQVIMVGALCFVMNDAREVPMKKWNTILIYAMVTLYYIGWVFYYFGTVNLLLIVILSVTPGVAFLIFSIARKNIIAMIATIVFLICHLIASLIIFMF